MKNTTKYGTKKNLLADPWSAPGGIFVRLRPAGWRDMDGKVDQPALTGVQLAYLHY